MNPVASFFQDDTESALILKVQWLQTEADISDRFFSSLLRVDERVFHGWKAGDEAMILPHEARNHLKEFWRVILHILSFLNFDLSRVTSLLDHKDVSKTKVETSFSPPWAGTGTSMKTYMETNGPPSIEKVDHWVQALRFANSH